jgi:hypothetical protein
MKHIRKFNESNNIDLSSSLKELFNEEVEVRIPLNYLLKETNFLILTEDGKIYEFESGRLEIAWDSDEEFKDQTGASINEYSLNQGEEFLNFLRSIDYDYMPKCDSFADYSELIDEIDSIYFKDEPSEVLKYIISNMI